MPHGIDPRARHPEQIVCANRTATVVERVADEKKRRAAMYVETRATVAVAGTHVRFIVKFTQRRVPPASPYFDDRTAVGPGTHSQPRSALPERYEPIFSAEPAKQRSH